MGSQAKHTQGDFDNFYALCSTFLISHVYALFALSSSLSHQPLIVNAVKRCQVLMQVHEVQVQGTSISIMSQSTYNGLWRNIYSLTSSTVKL